jgi:hypothetical protein
LKEWPSLRESMVAKSLSGKVLGVKLISEECVEQIAEERASGDKTNESEERHKTISESS